MLPGPNVNRKSPSWVPALCGTGDQKLADVATKSSRPAFDDPSDLEISIHARAEQKANQGQAARSRCPSHGAYPSRSSDPMTGERDFNDQMSGVGTAADREVRHNGAGELHQEGIQCLSP